MATLTGLDAFLALLQSEGILVGPKELTRLRHAFGMNPALDREGLKALLACIVVKSKQEQERFEALFDDWFRDNASAWRQWGGRRRSAKPETSHRLFPQPGARRVKRGAASLAKKPAKVKASEIPKKQWFYRETLWFGAVVVVASAVFLIWQLFSPLLKQQQGVGKDPLAGVASAVPDGVIHPPTPPPTELPTDPMAGLADASPSVLGSTDQPRTLLPTDLPTEPVAVFHTWVPELEVVTWEKDWLPGVLGIAAGAFLLFRYRRRRRLPSPAPPPNEDGSAWLPMVPLQSSGPELLGSDELRTLVWGIGHFVADEYSHKVDVGKTVAATARGGGIPALRFQPLTYHREVWLWQDELTQDPTLEWLADELEASLGRAGLPVRRGWFADVPEVVAWREGQAFSPLVLEGHRQNAVVAVLTDGQGIGIAVRSDLDRRPLTQLLNSLSQWPQLTFVDFGRGRHGLAALVRGFGVNCIAPEALPSFLGVGEAAPLRPRHEDARLLGDLRAWAAATTLAPEPVEGSEAFDLRRRLGLELSPWTFRDLLRSSEDRDGRLVWSPPRRAELLNWLVRTEGPDNGTVVNRLLAGALDFWRDRLARERSQREESESALEPWTGSLAEQRLGMEEALLDLWREPKRAARSLFRLYGEPGKEGLLAREIRTRLKLLAPWDWRGNKGKNSAVVFLPWRWGTMDDKTRYMLGTMGLGKGLQQTAGKLQSPGRVGLAVGLCWGLGTLTLGFWSWDLLTPVPLLTPVEAVFDNKIFRGFTIQDSRPVGHGRYEVVVGTPRNLLRTENPIPAASEIKVSWRWEKRENPLKFGDSELWRAGTLPQVIRGCTSDEEGAIEWPRRSLVVIGADPGDKDARKLTIRLLDRGSADAVLLGENWEQHYRKKLIQVDGTLTEQDQLLVVLPSESWLPGRPEGFQGRYTAVAANDFEVLISALDFPGNRLLEEVEKWKDLDQRVGGSQGVLLRGGPEEYVDRKTKIRFAWVCGGTFTMGSGEKDKRANDLEKPAHQVVLSPFWISKSEVTNAQYRRLQSDHKENDIRPVVVVDWDQAREFCEKIGGALPTEAQWEYAARGGTTTLWSFGDDKKQLGGYTWFSDYHSGYLQPVSRKWPNPLGFYDMHGNAWEWVEDCYDGEVYSRRGALTVDPLEASDGCQYRVLRGGALFFSARDRRSASRFRGMSRFRSRTNGFRCAFGPRR